MIYNLINVSLHYTVLSSILMYNHRLHTMSDASGEVPAVLDLGVNGIQDPGSWATPALIQDPGSWATPARLLLTKEAGDALLPCSWSLGLVHRWGARGGEDGGWQHECVCV